MTKRGDYRTPTEEDKAVSWGDYGRAVGSGAVGIGTGLAALTEYATEGAVGGETRKALSKVSEDLVGGMSPNARRAYGAAFIPTEGEQSVLEAGVGRSLGLKSAAALPSLIAAIIPAGIAGTIARGAGAAASAAVAGGTARAAGGLMNAGDVTQQIFSELDKMSDDKLFQSSSLFAGYVSSGMSSQEARRKYYNDVAGVAPIAAGAISAMLGGVEAQVGRRLGGEAGKGVVRGAISGGVAEFAQEAAETGSGEFLSQAALKSQDLKEMDWLKILSQTIEGGVVGFGMGAGVGGVTNIGGRRAENGVSVLPPGAPDPAQQLALGAAVPPAPAVPRQPSPAAGVTPPKGTGTGVAPKPAENIDVGNPQSAPTRSATEYPEGGVTGEVTVPETPESLQDQQEKLVAGDIPAMLFPWTQKPARGVQGRTQELALPEGFDRVTTREGIIHFDPKVYKRQAIITAVDNGRINDILGYVQSKPEVAMAEAAGDGPARAIVERGPNGEERGAALVSPSQEAAQVEMFRRRQSPDSTIVRETPAETLEQRMQNAPPFRRSTPRPTNPEQEYWDAFADYKAEQTAQQPVEASPENVAYDVEPPPAVTLTPEQNERLRFINEDRPAGQKMTPEEFLVSGDQEYDRQIREQAPSTPAKPPKVAKAVEVAKAKAPKAPKASKPPKVAKAVEAAAPAPAPGPLFTAPVKQTPAPKPPKAEKAIAAAKPTPTSETAQYTPKQQRTLAAAEQAANEVKVKKDSDGFREIAYPGGTITVEPPSSYAGGKARAAPGFRPTGGRVTSFFHRDTGSQGARAGAAFIDELGAKGAVPLELHQVFRDILDGKLSSTQEIAVAIRRARMNQLLEENGIAAAKPTPAPEPGPLFAAEVKAEPAPEKPRGLTRLEARAVEKRAREEAAKAEQPSKGKNRSKAEKAAIDKQHDFGREAAKREPSKDEFYFGPEQDDLLRRSKDEPSAFVQSPAQLRALETRLQKIVDDAKAAGVNVEDRTKANPTGLQKKVFPETPDGVMYLRVVKDMLGLLKQRRTSDKIKQALNQFVVEEHAVRKGDFSLMRERRQVEGSERNRRDQGNVEAPEGAAATKLATASPEEILEQNEQAMRRELALQELERQREALEKGEIKEIDADKIRQIAGVEAKPTAEEKPAAFKRKKVTSESKSEEPPAPTGRKLEVSEEDKARYASLMTKVEARPRSLTDAEIARDRAAKKAASADEWLKANDPAYREAVDKGVVISPVVAEESKAMTPKARQARMAAARAQVNKLQAQATRAINQGATGAALEKLTSEISRLQNQIAADERVLRGDLPVPDLLGPISSRKADGSSWADVYAAGDGRQLVYADDEVALIKASAINGRDLYVPASAKNGMARVDVDSFVNTKNVFTAEQLERLKAIKKQITDAEAAARPTNAVQGLNGQWVAPEESAPITEALQKVNWGKFGPLFSVLRDRMLQEIRGTNVHIVSPEDMFRLTGDSGALGLYQYSDDKGENVFIRSDLDYEQRIETFMHEAGHALVMRVMRKDPKAHAAVQRIARSVQEYYAKQGVELTKQFPAARYAYKNTEEFIAEAMGNQEFQRLLAATPLDAQLAQDLGVYDWRNKTLWQALVEVLARIVKVPVSALDAIMQQVDLAANQRAGINPTDAPISAARLGDREDLTDRGNAFKSWLSRAAVKGSTLDQMRQLYRGLFKDSNGDALERVIEGIQRITPYAAKKRERAEQLAQRFIDYSRNNPQEAAELADIAIDATMSNVQLGPNANNKHLDKGWRGWQGKKHLANLQGRYDALGEEGRALYDEMAKYYRDMQNEMTEGLINNILDEVAVNPPDRQAFIKRVMDGQMSADDETLLADKPTTLKALKEAREVRAVKGDYFPLMRNGDYVVVTEDNIKDLMGGTEIEPGKVEFRGASRKAAMDAAKAFAEASPLRAINLQQSPDTATSTDFGVIVTVQKKGVFFFESETEANKWRRENADNFDSVSQVQDRLATARTSADLTTAQFNSLMASIERQGADEATKATMKNIMEQAAARMMSGNRVQQRSITRRNVQGASKDFGRNLIQYGQAAGGYLAKIKYMPSVREGLKSMTALARQDMSGDAPQRVRVLNEIRQRIDQGVIEPNEAPRWLSDLMTLTFLGKLFSPMYSVVNGMQPWMVTYPVLAGRYGTFRASAALAGAYRSLGFSDTIGGGLRNTYLAGKQFTSAGLLDTSDISGSIKKKVAGDPDGAELVKVIDMALERGAMSAGGFELAQSIAEGRGAWGTGLSKVDRIARQLPQAVEDVNRAVTLIAAYRLARGANMSEEKAASFAFDTVMNTQGDYSAANAPRFFSNPYLRPALQFKKYAQMMTFLLADMVHKSFKGASPEERRAAQKQLLNVLSVQIAMAGALSLPGLEIAKMGFMVAAALGFGQGWDDREEELRKFADATLGKTWGELVSRGIVSRALNIDISQRVSLADMWTFGEPKKYDKDNLNAYLAQLMFGAPGSTAADFFNGVRDMGKGDVLKGVGQMLPIKFVSDAFKAANNYSEGKATTTEVGMNIFGVRSGRQAEKGREVGAKVRERDDMQRRYKDLSDQYLKARNSGERAVIRARIVEHNKTAPLRYKVFPGALDKVKQRIDAERVN